jgi:hypothetical protein
MPHTLEKDNLLLDTFSLSSTKHFYNSNWPLFAVHTDHPLLALLVRLDISRVRQIPADVKMLVVSPILSRWAIVVTVLLLVIITSTLTQSTGASMFAPL